MRLITGLSPSASLPGERVTLAFTGDVDETPLQVVFSSHIIDTAPVDGRTDRVTFQIPAGATSGPLYLQQGERVSNAVYFYVSNISVVTPVPEDIVLDEIGKEIAVNLLLIFLKEEFYSDEEAQRVAGLNGAVIVGQIPPLRAYQVKLQTRSLAELWAAAAIYEADPAVEFAVPDQKVPCLSVDWDPCWGDQRLSNNVEQGATLYSKYVHPSEPGKIRPAPVTIGVLESSGMDWNIADFDRREALRNDDGSLAIAIFSSHPGDYFDESFNEGCWSYGKHGTIVTGIIAAELGDGDDEATGKNSGLLQALQDDNGRPAHGGFEILVEGGDIFCEDPVQFFHGLLQTTINMCNDGAKVINWSWGWYKQGSKDVDHNFICEGPLDEHCCLMAENDFFDKAKKAIEITLKTIDLFYEQVVVVAAAGNFNNLCDVCDESSIIPAGLAGANNIDNLIVVGAHRYREFWTDYEKIYFSSFGPRVDIAATGVVKGSDGRAEAGTSYAAPLVTATIAAMQSINPNLSPGQIRHLLRISALPIYNNEVIDSNGIPVGVVFTAPITEDEVGLYDRRLEVGMGARLNVKGAIQAAIESLFDGDGILNDGDCSGIVGDNPCTGGNTVNCDDNCPKTHNPDQADFDGDGDGDACDTDDDNDGIVDDQDAFPLDPTEWIDTDGDGIGNNTDIDDDNDGIVDDEDAFPNDPNEWGDSDNDNVGDNSDNCPSTYNPDQADSDGNGVGDACEVDLTTGLVAYYPLDGNTDDVVGGNHGTAHGGFSYVPGTIGQAASFDGVDDHIEIPDSNTLDLASSFSLSAWVKSSDMGTVISKWEWCVNNRGFYFASWDSPTLGVSQGSVCGGFSGYGKGTQNINDDNFHHLAAIFDNGQYKLYIDGEVNIIDTFEVDTNDSNATFLTQGGCAGYKIDTTEIWWCCYPDIQYTGVLGIDHIQSSDLPVRIGSMWTHCNGENSGNAYFNGLIDEVRVYNRALTEPEIQALFNESGPIDSDGDGIYDDGDDSGTAGDNPCTGGETENCDDNCPNTYNPDQADSDGDGVGDVCEGPDVSGIIPDTGQTQCYDDTGEIPCPEEGEPFYGQDAQYTTNPQSYTKLDENGNDLPDSATEWVMVRDNVTGLIWEVKGEADGTADYSNPHDVDNTYTWYDSNSETNSGYPGWPGDGTDTEDFINALNNAQFGGYNDWRIPSLKELSCIVNSGTYDPTIDINYFSGIVSFLYWSSSTVAISHDLAWYVYFLTGRVSNTYKSGSFYARAVRGGLYPNTFEDNGDGTVTDTSTGLMWQQEMAGPMRWEEALAYCESLSLAGHDDWRLPNRNELQSIVDYSSHAPAIDNAAFPIPTVPSYYYWDYYWSSSTYADPTYTGYAWTVKFLYGTVSGYSKFNSNSVRAVRGGQ